MSRITSLVLRLSLLALLTAPVAAASLHGLRIRQVLLGTAAQPADPAYNRLKTLLQIKAGGTFDQMDIRRSMDNLFRTTLFSAITVRVVRQSENSVDLCFEVQPKPTILYLTCSHPPGFNRHELLNAIYSMRRGDPFTPERLDKAKQETRTFLRERGFFHAVIQATAVPINDGRAVRVRLDIDYGRRTRIKTVTISCPDPLLVQSARKIIATPVYYVPRDHEARLERLRRFLLQNRHLAAIVRTRETFPDPDQTVVDLTVEIEPGYRYAFVFNGMRKRYDLIAGVWEKNVFERFAEEESRRRLLNYLKNRGFLDASIDANVAIADGVKTVTFNARSGRRYRLGEVRIAGNQALDDERIRSIISSDDQLFDRLFWLRFNTLVVDLEVLKLYYYYHGFSDINIQVEPVFHENRADVVFRIQEGALQTVAAVNFSGNRAISADELQRQIRSHPGIPFVSRQVDEDQKTLQDFYEDHGYEGTVVSVATTGEQRKVLQFSIREGELMRMGDLVIIGASRMQRSLIRRLSPLHTGAPFSRRQLAVFQSKLEENSIFADLHIDPVIQADQTIDLIVRAVADRSKFYGFGFGYEQRKDPHVSLEYLDRNIFNSYSIFSGIAQVGFHAAINNGLILKVTDRRGVIAFDTPFLLRSGMNSSLKIWEETEVYPSYEFNRWGAGFTLNKKIHSQLVLEGALKWYRTNLTTLYDISLSDAQAAELPQTGIDQLGKPFDTTALSLSLVHENRNDPFNPSSGDFLSADLKLGLPLLEKDYTFLKFFWNYQRHRRLLRNAVFSISIKNGFGFGDMSISERFFAGGSHSFRGVRDDRLGPLILSPTGNSDTAEANRWIPVGGNALFLINAEITFPSLLIPIDDLFYTIFLDYGNVFRKSSDFSLNKMERAIGFGLKYRTAMGPIRIELAWNLRRNNGKTLLFQIGIGNVY